MDRVKDLASKKAAVIFTKSSCYMCHSIKQLFYELGASPAVYELDNDSYGREMEWALTGNFGSMQPFSSCSVHRWKICRILKRCDISSCWWITQTNAYGCKGHLVLVIVSFRTL
jgi:hypothetical protein